MKIQHCFNTIVGRLPMAFNDSEEMPTAFGLNEGFGNLNDFDSDARSVVFKIFGYQDIPHKIHHNIQQPNHRTESGVQVFNQEAAETIVKNANGMIQRVASLFRGIPIYEGHPQLQPGKNHRAKGWVKNFEVREDGLYGEGFFSAEGFELIHGAAAAYASHSPGVLVKNMGGGRFLPIILDHIALTNSPRMTDLSIGVNEGTQPNYTMLTKEQLAKLGLTEGATAEEIATALNSIHENIDTFRAANARLKNAADADALKIDELELENTSAKALALNAMTTASTQIVADAIKGGKIKAADKESWETKLAGCETSTAFNEKVEELGKLSIGLNTNTDAAKEAAAKSEEGGTAMSFNSELTKVAATHGIDITDGNGWNQASNILRQEKPELFLTEAQRNAAAE